MLKSVFFALAFLVPASMNGCDSDDKEPAPEGALVVTAAFTDALATGQNRLTVTVKDEAGAVVTGATITVDPQMPMHGHGSSEVAVVTEKGAGIYEAFPVTFQMPGAWVVHVDAALGTQEGNIDLDVTVP